MISGSSTVAATAINKAMAPGNVIILEGEVTNTAVVSTDVLVVGWDFKFW